VGSTFVFIKFKQFHKSCPFIFLKEMLNTLQMFLIFRNKIRPVLNNKPQITLSLLIRQPKNCIDLKYLKFWNGYAGAELKEISTHFLRSCINKFNNPVDDINPDDT
jgi:hypothetical protein